MPDRCYPTEAVDLNGGSLHRASCGGIRLDGLVRKVSARWSAKPARLSAF